MKKLAIAVAALAAIVLFTWGIVATSEPKNGGDVADRTAIESVDLDQSDARPPASETAELVEKVLPSVVTVRVKQANFDVLGEDQETGGHGSGVVLDENGIIVTNFHVVAGAVDVQVDFADGRSLEGRVVGGVPERDLAVVQVDADDLTPIELGKSESLRLGDDVIAIGFPLGVGGPTVTKGILSATDRTITPVDGFRLTDMLQTDAAINPGNSGGPLVDGNGRLVGINSAAAAAAAAENVGFAIPVDEALPIVQQLLSEPAEERAWLGVQTAALDELIAGQLGLPVDEGALVAGAFEGSPAAGAGIEQGEVIIAVDDHRIATPNDLVETLGEYAPGDEVTLTIVGTDGERTETVRLDQRPATFPVGED
jgi:S1-C subfamily serine protease